MGKRTRRSAITSSASVLPQATPTAQGRFQYSKSYLARLAAETLVPPLIPIPDLASSLALLPASLADQNDQNPINFPSTSSHSQPSPLLPSVSLLNSIDGSTINPADPVAPGSTATDARSNLDDRSSQHSPVQGPAAKPHEPAIDLLSLDDSAPQPSDSIRDRSDFDDFASPIAVDELQLPDAHGPPLAEDVYGLGEPELPSIATSTSENEDATAPPAKRVRVRSRNKTVEDDVPSNHDEDAREAADVTEGAGLGDFSRVFSYISAEKTRLLASPRSRSRLSSVEPLDPTTSPLPLASNAASTSTLLRSPSDIPRPLPAPLEATFARRTEKASYSRRIDALSTTDVESSSSPAVEASPENSNSSHKATYVRNAASAGVSAAVELDPRRATYERPASFKQSTASGSAFPLSSTDKARNLVKKLEEAFPNFVISPSLYAPIVQQPFHPGTGPSKEVVHGFWPAPPPRNTGKGLYPAPLIIPDAPAPADDKRPRVEVFVDNSNVIYTFLNWLRTRPEAKLKQLGDKSSRSVFVGGKKGKMDYTTLFAILERGRNIERRVLVASSPLWQGLEISTQLGYEVSVMQRVPRPTNAPNRTNPNDSSLGATASTSIAENKTEAKLQSRLSKAAAPAKNLAYQYKEQGVDELIHMKILESLLDFSPSPADPARPLLVIATGDAGSSEYAPNGFLGCVRRALERGWDVEIVAFHSGTSSSWIAEATRAEAMASEMGDGVGQRGRLRVVDLGDFAEELVL